MSEERNERATVALVAERLESLRELVRAEFKGIERQLDAVSGLPLIVNGLIEKVKQHEEEIDELRREKEKARDWRMGPLFANLIGLAGVLVAVVAIVFASHA